MRKGSKMKIKVGDKVRDKTLHCDATVTCIREGSFGMTHVEIETQYGKYWCFLHNLEEPSNGV